MMHTATKPTMGETKRKGVYCRNCYVKGDRNGMTRLTFFFIIREDGKIRWTNTKHDYLYDPISREMICTCGDCDAKTSYLLTASAML